METLSWLLLAVAAGMLIPMQNSLNAQLGRYAGHPLITTLLVFIAGAVACLGALALFRPLLPAAVTLCSAPAAAWAGGPIALVYVVVVISVIPKLGAGLTTTGILVGQVVIALLLDHYGWLGNAQHVLSAPRLAGLGMMLVGLVLIRQF